jgi:acyl-coenzyme A thioesterase PaaI-like protein
MASTEWAGSDFQAPPRTDGGVALCAACRRTGACRLGLSTEVLGADDVARFDIVCPPEHEGGPGVAHGGWTAAVLDEVLGHVPLLHGTLSVTKKLEVEYLRPVPIGRPLVASGWVERTEPGYWHIVGELVLVATHAPLARARGVWALRDRSHFARYERWLAEQDATAATEH